MQDTVIRDDNIILRKMKEEDLDFLLVEQGRTENSEYVPQWRKETHLDALKDSDFLYLIIKAVSDFRPLGYAILSGLESYNNSIYLNQIVIAEKRKGYGKAALKLIKSLVFNDLRAHRFHFEVWTHNAAAVDLYKSEGFFEEGNIRDCVIRKHRYLSYLIMSMLENEYYDQDRR